MVDTTSQEGTTQTQTTLSPAQTGESVTTGQSSSITAEQEAGTGTEDNLTTTENTTQTTDHEVPGSGTTTTTTTTTDSNGNTSSTTTSGTTSNGNSSSSTTPSTSGNSTSSNSDASQSNQVLDSSLTTTIPKDTSFDVRPITVTGEENIAINTRQLESVGNDGAVSWKFTTTIPDGLSLNASTGEITGTPTTKGSVSVTVVGTDPKGNQGTADIVFNIFSSMEVPLPKKGIPVETGDSVGFVVQVLGGSGTYRFTLDTLHYPNLYIDPVSGGIRGTFYEPGQYDVPVQVFDGFSTLTVTIPFVVRGVIVNDATFLREKRTPRMAELGMESLDNYIENLSRSTPDYPASVVQFLDVCCKLCADPTGEFLDKFRIAMIDYGNTLFREQNYLRGSLGLLSNDQRLFVTTIYTYWRGIIYYKKSPEDLDWNEFLRVTRSQPQLQYLTRFGSLNK